jgi:hypothetical protein
MNLIVKRPNTDYPHGDSALTLTVSEVTDSTLLHELADKEFTRTHPDGWSITGIVQYDYYAWVNEFSAVHPEYGRVWGNFEIEVYADSEEGFTHFYQHHQPKSWDYAEI